MSSKAPLLFVDSNVLIEAVLIPQSAAAILSDLVSDGTFDMATCALAVVDAEKAILNKIQKLADLDIVVERWDTLQLRLRLEILPDPSFDEVRLAYDKYIGVMRHKADIPILAAALSCKPTPIVILSGNRALQRPGRC